MFISQIYSDNLFYRYQTAMLAQSTSTTLCISAPYHSVMEISHGNKPPLCGWLFHLKTFPVAALALMLSLGLLRPVEKKLSHKCLCLGRGHFRSLVC